jgi:hypothetical protein
MTTIDSVRSAGTRASNWSRSDARLAIVDSGRLAAAATPPPPLVAPPPALWPLPLGVVVDVMSSVCVRTGARGVGWTEYAG